jgi:hypothetical protein
MSAADKQKLASDKVWNYEDDYLLSLNEKDCSWMNSFPEYAIKDFSGGSVLVSHYIYPNFSGYMLFNSNEAAK